MVREIFTSILSFAVGEYHKGCLVCGGRYFRKKTKSMQTSRSENVGSLGLAYDLGQDFGKFCSSFLREMMRDSSRPLSVKIGVLVS